MGAIETKLVGTIDPHYPVLFCRSLVGLGYGRLSLAFIGCIFYPFCHRSPQACSKKSYPRSYKPKGDFLLSLGEKKFFDALVQSVPEDMYICPNVRDRRIR
jgi:hypothetical protein